VHLHAGALPDARVYLVGVSDLVRALELPRRLWPLVVFSMFLPAPALGAAPVSEQSHCSLPDQGRCPAWTKTYSHPTPDGRIGYDQAVDLAVDPASGRTFLLGYTVDEITGTDYTTVAFAPKGGDVLWEARHDAPGPGFEVPTALAISPDGRSLYVTGAEDLASTDDGSIGTVAYDAVTGEERWSNYHGGPAGADDVGRAVSVSPDGSRVYVAGYVRGDASDDVVALAYDAGTGEELWATSLDGPDHLADRPVALAVTPGGDQVVIAATQDAPPNVNEPATADMLVVAFATGADGGSTGGQERWRAEIDRGGYDAAAGLAIDPSGRTAIVTGTSASAGGVLDALTVSLLIDTGTRIWTSRYDGPSHEDDAGRAIALDAAGDRAYVAMRSRELAASAGGVSVSDTDSITTVAYEAGTGEQVWTHDYVAASHERRFMDARDVVVTPAGRVIVTGFASPWNVPTCSAYVQTYLGVTCGDPVTDLAVAAYQPDGALAWKSFWNRSSNDLQGCEPAALAVSPANHPVIAATCSKGPSANGTGAGLQDERDEVLVGYDP
jgi:hypothetical protein